jgi:hypothetical protein
MDWAPEYPHYPHIVIIYFTHVCVAFWHFTELGTRSLADRRMVFTFFVQIILDAFQELRQPECVHGSIKPVIKNVRDYYDCIIIVYLFIYLFNFFFFFCEYICCAMPTNYLFV